MKLIVVDPQNDPRLIDWVMTKVEADDKRPFNLLSLLDYGWKLKNLEPTQDEVEYLKDSQFGDANTHKFDMSYAARIMTHNNTFVDFMHLISTLPDEEDTILITNYNSRFVMPVIDSLLKLIQQRYGIDAFIVNTVDDLEGLSIKYCEFGSTVQRSLYVGDWERYAKLTNKPATEVKQNEVEEDMNSMYESMETTRPIV